LSRPTINIGERTILKSDLPVGAETFGNATFKIGSDSKPMEADVIFSKFYIYKGTSYFMSGASCLMPNCSYASIL
jgi:hypothetical protein